MKASIIIKQNVLNMAWAEVRLLKCEHTEQRKVEISSGSRTSNLITNEDNDEILLFNTRDLAANVTSVVRENLEYE